MEVLGRINLIYYLALDHVTRFVLELVDEEVVDCPGRIICSESPTQVGSGWAGSSFTDLLTLQYKPESVAISLDLSCAGVPMLRARTRARAVRGGEPALCGAAGGWQPTLHTVPLTQRVYLLCK